MINKNKQKGMTAIGIALVLAILAFFVMLALVLTPIYLENLKIKSHLSNIAKDSGFAKLTQDEMMERLFRRFNIDDIDNVTREDVVIEESDTDIKMAIEYEVRSPILFNVDVVVYFNENIVVPR